MRTCGRLVAAGLLVAAVLTAAAAASGHRARVASGAVPTHTTATSISFVSTSEAFVLGTAPCPHKPCTVIARTSDLGVSWVGLPAPVEAVSRADGNGLWGLRFADPQRGFAYGKGVWATSDGGQSWKRTAGPARFVLAIEAVADRQLVAIGSSCGDDEKCAPNLDLYIRPLAKGAWRRIPGVKPLGFGGGLAVHGRTVWVLLGAELLVSTDAGQSFTVHGMPCPHGKNLLPMPASISDDGSHTYLLCIGQGFTGHTIKFVYRTTGTSRGWTKVARAPAAGAGGELAVGSDHAVVIATASGASWLYRSSDAGRHWGTALLEPDGGAGWADLGFTTPQDGVVIHGPAQTDGGSPQWPGQVLLTDDGGHSWHAVRF